MRPIRPVDPLNVNHQITMVATHQPEYQTLPSLFMKDNNICVSRWAFEEHTLPGESYSERELLKEYQTLWLYVSSNRAIDNLPGHFLSTKFISEQKITEELKFNNNVFEMDNGVPLIIKPEKSQLQDNVFIYRWDLFDEQIIEALESNSIFIYQLNLRLSITPILVSLYHGLIIQ